MQPVMTVITAVTKTAARTAVSSAAGSDAVTGRRTGRRYGVGAGKRFGGWSFAEPWLSSSELQRPRSWSARSWHLRSLTPSTPARAAGSSEHDLLLSCHR